jgi:hypothetical protein
MIDINFSIASVRAEPHAAAPTLVFGVAFQETAGTAIHAGLLRCQVYIEVRRRRYSPVEGERLSELVGERPRWNETMHPLLWTTVPFVLPRCEGSAQVELPVACTYDFEVASTKYFHALDGDEVPLLFMFSGTIFAAGPSGVQAAQVPWEKEARFRLPVRVWRDAMDQHFGDATWIRLSRESLDALDRVRRQRGLLTWDQLVQALCAQTPLEPVEPV